MSFFLKENFDLPAGAFQTGVDTETAGNGVVYQDGAYGYIKTYADADGAIIVSADSLTPGEFGNKTIKVNIHYKLVSLPASDSRHIFGLVQKATQPIVGTIGNIRLGCFIFNNAGTYQEHWWYLVGATEYYYKQSTGLWVTPWSSASYARNTIALNTEYTITITINPVTHTAVFTNDTQTATSGAFTRGTDPWWWFSGDYETGSTYGQDTLISLAVDDASKRDHFTIRNCLTKAYQKSSILTLLNNLTTRHRDSFTLKNSILDHTPYRSNFTLLNNIGVEGQLVYLDGSWQTKNIKGKQIQNASTVEIDGLDVSDKMNDWSIDYDDQVMCKTVSVTIKDRAYAESIKLRKYDDSDFDDARIEIIDIDGYSLGEFLIEDKTENAAHKSYSCTLSGRSMTALLDKPYSERLNTLYSTATTKKAVVDALSLVKSLTVTWGIPDSILPIGALTCDDEPPISIIKKVVEAGGGLVYTDRADNLVCAYKDYETTGQTPVLSLTSGDIVSISTSRTVPDGENSVEVSGYQDVSITDGWATISLKASKYRLASNGYDSCTITATCFNEDLTIPDVALVTNEEVEPDDNDHFQLSVSQMIDVDGQGVVTIVKKSDSSLVAGPYEVQDDGRTIRVDTAMADTTYQVTYYGGTTVSFGVDQLVDISPTEVLIHKGKATATLRASAGGGGYATVSGDYSDAQTAKLAITISDPRVGNIELTAEPSSVSTINAGTRESTITIVVTDSDGYAAANGISIDLFVADQYNEPDYTGIVDPTTVTTTTSTLTEGTIDAPINCTSETVVHTNHPITTLVSIYRFDGSWDTSVNYATGATVDGNQITLLTPLPSPLDQVQIVYTATGTATATYTYTKNCPPASRYNFVRAFAGEWGQCSVTISGPAGSGGGEDSAEGSSKTFYLDFAGTFTPKPGSNGQQSFVKSTGIPSDDWTLVTGALEGTENIKNGTVAGLQRIEGDTEIFFTLTMRASVDPATYDLLDQNNKVSGKRLVEDSITKAPIQNASVTIFWADLSPGSEGPLYTNSEGYFFFYKGKAGETAKVSITKTDYDNLDSTIAIA